MDMSVLFLIGLIPPILGLLVVILVLKFLFTSNKSTTSDRKKYLNTAISELRSYVLSGQTTIAGLLEQYTKELTALEPVLTVPQNLATPLANPNDKAIQPPQAHESISLNNWYSENSINLMLYIGAFLIITSASIFVGFQWSSIGGPIKAFLLTLLSVGFLCIGLWLHSMPKVRNAGTTFTAIGTLLIPLVGYGWYNFVLMSMGVSFGFVWIVTSLVSTIISIVIGIYLHSSLYTYIASLGSLSFILGIVHMTRLQNEFYILGAQLSSLLLLGIRNILPKNENTPNIYEQPISISANIITPIALFMAMTLAISNNQFFRLETGVSLLIGASFYLFSYIVERKLSYLIIAKCLFPVGVAILMKNYGETSMLFSIDFIAFLYLLISYLWKKYGYKELSESSAILSITISIITYILHGNYSLTPLTVTLLAGFAGILTYGASYSLPPTVPILLSGLFMAIFARHEIYDVYSLDKFHILGYVYITCAFLWYVGGIIISKGQDFTARYINTAFFCLLALSLTLALPFHIIIISFLIMLLLTDASFRFTSSKLITLSSVSLFFTVWNILSYLKMPTPSYPYYFLILSLMLYFISYILPKVFQKNVQYISYIGMLLAAYLPSFFSGGAYGSYQDLTREATKLHGLVSMAVIFLFFILESYILRSTKRKYLASFVGMSLYSATLSHMGVRDMLLFTIPWSLYLYVLAYTKRQGTDESMVTLLDIGGSIFLFLPSFGSIFSSNGGRDAAILGFVGLGLFSLGVTLKMKHYRSIGIAALALAVLSQTYSYIFGLEKWMIVGLLGFIFLIGAMGLLLKRSVPHPQNKE